MRKAARENPSVWGRLVLASSSPRRAALLARAGFSFSVEVSDVDESAPDGETPATTVARLAYEKADRVQSRYPWDAVLAADTLVVLDGAALGKPASGAEAREMLARLRDRIHVVLTGVCLLRPNAPAAVRVVETLVRMRSYDPTEVSSYIESGAPLDKAGGYGIQDRAFRPVHAIRGCYTNVVGLPLCAVSELLAEGMDSVSAEQAVCNHAEGWIAPPLG
jgi:MAF protein